MTPHPSLPELLAPAGTEAAFRCAVAAGADAVYCGLSELNARRGAENLSEERFEACCELAHLAGTRVYLTENIAVKEAEFPRAVELARRAAELGADGVIVADLGLIDVLSREAPELELHVSTQANVGDERGVAWCVEHGASRVTLSRELTLSEIRACAEAGRELGVACEVFCHGALCMAYSGLCRMSALRGQRSANRGLCAQPCRLPHRLLGEGGRALSPEESRALCPKDLCALDELAELVDAGVAALKIEGRMKGPEYVFGVVRAWRGALDALSFEDGRASVPASVLDEARGELLRSFNRSFTSSYLHGASGNEMMSYERSNNRGILCGSVAESSGCAVVVRLAEAVGEGDLLEFRPERDPSRFLTEPAPRDAEAGEALALTLKRPMPEGTPVRALRQEATIRAAKAAAKAPYPRLRPVSISAELRLGEPARLKLATPTRSVEERERYGEAVSAEALGPVMERARTRALTAEDVRAHLARLGGTPFELESSDIALDDGLGLGFSALHRLRAQAVEELERKILEAYRLGPLGEPELPAPAEPIARTRPERLELCCLCPSVEVARAARAADAQRVYLASEAYVGEDASDGPWIPWLGEVSRAADRAAAEGLLRAGEPCAASTFAELQMAAERGALFEATWEIPLFNSRSLAALARSGATGAWLSFELSAPEIAGLARTSPLPLGVKVAGALRAMTTEHCVLQVAGPCDGRCQACERRGKGVVLRNIDGRRLPVLSAGGRSRIYWDEPVDLVAHLAQIRDAGVARVLVDATLMGASEAAAEIRRVERAIAALDGARAPAVGARRTTLGHFLEPVR